MSVLADLMAEAILERGAMATCHLAAAVGTRKADVRAELDANPDRFVHNGLRARASRWDLRPVEPIRWPEDFEDAEEALVNLIRSGDQTPEEALVRIATAWAAS